MNDFSEFWDVLGYDGYFLVFLMVLFFLYVIMLIYKSVIVFAKDKVIKKDEEDGVSVIITSNNKADYLKENLEYFLTQDYSHYEVIVVDECSEDNTQDVLAEMQQRFPNLRSTRIFPDTKFRSTKKIAINIGVLAANYDILIFSEINCRPATSGWIKTMQSYFNGDVAVVLGFTNYTDTDGSISVRRFFRFLRFLKMLFLIKTGSYVIGDGCNMAYRKKYYIANRGFSKNSQIYMGYDSEMVKMLSKKGKVRVVKDETAYMLINDKRYKTWMEDFSYYYSSKREWSFLTLVKSESGTVIKSLFYILSFYLIFSGVLHNYIGACVLLTFLTDLIVTNIYARHLKQRKLFLTSFIIITIGFIYKCYYNIYSIFTSKKWR